MKVLITGNMGYIGPVLNQFLVREDPAVEITGFDSGFFAHSLTGAHVNPESGLKLQHFGDVRDIERVHLEGVDAVVHLAGVSNDPIGNEFESVTSAINRAASARLAEISVNAGVKNFVFASSCSMYGDSEGGPRKESDPTNPLTAYARSKIDTENDIQNLKLGSMVFTSMRFSTACGWSPRLRLDLVLNDFVACAITTKKITVLSDGTPWRPLIDVEDMSRAISWAIKRRADNGGQYLAVNIGSSESNYQVRDLAVEVAKQLPGTIISVNTSAPPDKRSYAVDFSLFKSLAPNHQPIISLQESINRLKKGLLSMRFADGNFRDSPFLRLNTLRKHIEAARLTPQLRWNNWR
jgi:nucleoside-diphosphate-sugar epimerase